VNGDGRYGVALLLIVALLLGLAAWGLAGQQLLQYQREAIAAGQCWRLFTAHWAHLGMRHALLNVAGLCLLWAMLARHYRPLPWLMIVLISMAAIDLGLLLLQPLIQWYVGASGVLHGVWAAGGIAEWRRREWRSWMLLAVLVLKLCYEHWSGSSAVMPGMPVVLSAHVYGAIGGSLAAIGIMLMLPKIQR
jgi:rhomboid family GlyGly-CTERM serine protease